MHAAFRGNSPWPTYYSEMHGRWCVQTRRQPTAMPEDFAKHMRNTAMEFEVLFERALTELRESYVRAHNT